MFRVLVFAAMMLAGGVLAVRYVDHSARLAGLRHGSASGGAQPSNSRTMVIRAGDGGHFQVEARVDGRRMGFMVDTGASQIALRERDAARLGIHPTPRDYSIKVNTANGAGRAARVQLGMVEVGDIIVRDLPALIVPDEALSVNLLGMSFLSRVRWSHETASSCSSSRLPRCGRRPRLADFGRDSDGTCNVTVALSEPDSPRSADRCAHAGLPYLEAGMFESVACLTADGARLGWKRRRVIGLRLMKIAAGGAGAQNEVSRMVAEKVTAFAEAATTLATGGSARKVVRRYRTRVKANAAVCRGARSRAGRAPSSCRRLRCW